MKKLFLSLFVAWTCLAQYATYVVIDPTTMNPPADPTGKTDSTAAFQAAFNLQQNNYYGNAVIQIPAGLYVVTCSLTNTYPLNMVGSGSVVYSGISATNTYWGTTILYRGTNAPFLKLNDSGGFIGSLQILGQGGFYAQPYNAGIWINNANGWEFNYIRTGGLGYGWYFNAGNNNTWTGITWDSGSYYSSFYVVNGGTANNIQNLYLQTQYRNGVSDPSLTSVTNAVIDGTTTNITFTASGNLPAWIVAGQIVQLTGAAIAPANSLTGNNNANATSVQFLKSATANTFTISSPVAVSTVTLNNATITCNNNYQTTGALLDIEAGEFSIASADLEQSLVQGSTFINRGQTDIKLLHIENSAATNLTGSIYLIDNYGTLNVDTAIILNEPVLTGTTMYVIRDNTTSNNGQNVSAGAAARIGKMYLRDISSTGGTFNIGTVAGKGLTPLVEDILNYGTIRVLAVPTIGTYGVNKRIATSWDNNNVAVTGTFSVGANPTSVSNIRLKSFTLSGGTVTVSDALIKSNDLIIPCVTTTGGTQGALYIGTISASTSFVVKSTSGSDTSSGVCYIISQ
jgi:hypothetical protein